MFFLSRIYLYHFSRIVVLLFLAQPFSFGQISEQFDYQKLTYTLSKEIKDGNKKALRDLGSLLGHESIKKDAIKILRNSTLFTKEEFDFSAPFEKSTFLKFYYEQELNLKYSEILQAFYITPVEEQTIDYKILHPQKEETQDPSVLLRRLIKNLNGFIETGDDEQLIQQATRIANLDIPEGYEYLLDILKTEKLYQSQLKSPNLICEKLAIELIKYPTLETVQTIVFLVKNRAISPAFASPILAKLTNIYVTNDGRYEDLVPRYEIWLDSLKTMDEMHFFGYNQVLNFKKSFFQFPVDYYGKVLSQADNLPWIRHNALRDIVETQNPRALFYIAALAWRYRRETDKGKGFQKYVNKLEKLADLKVAINGEKGQLSVHDWKFDEAAARNFLKYWATNYQDYEWDDIRRSFMNKEEANALKENYEKLFRRLNSKNDSVALQSYILLTEGNPIEVLSLARKYKELLRNYNTTLPSFKHQYLEQLVQLTDFCKRNGFRYSPPPRLKPLLRKLTSSINQRERYFIENQIINRLAIDEVIALEYWTCLHENNPEITFSVGRILDRFYSKNWSRIVEDEEYLRLYLKKSHLFENIGVEGICNVYLHKFDQFDSSFKDKLKELLKVEGDEDIIFQIKELLAKMEGNTSQSLSDFLENPDFFMPIDIQNLPPPSKIFLDDLIVAIDSSNNKYHQKNWLQYLKNHGTLEMTPKLFEWLEKNIQPYVISSTLDNIFDHSFKTKAKEWLAYWNKNGETYDSWAQHFFDQKLMHLDTSSVLSDKEINAVILSQLFEQEDKLRFLKNIHKVKPARNIRRLKIDGWLSVKADLIHFNKIELSYKYLDDISKFFDLTTDKAMMVDWLLEKTADYTVDERGSFFNNLFQKNWFFDFVNDGYIASFVAEEIKITLQNYLAESDFMSEFEEQATIRNIALLENLGKTLEEKILHTLNLQVDENSKTSIEEAILARISYEDLPVVIKYFKDFLILKQYNFLNRDFGIPVFDLHDSKVQQELLINLKNKKSYDLYTHYLKKFGVDFQTATGDLDFGKIYKILQYDIVMPFVGSGGKKRDYYTYGIIKLLEFHFQTRLGFHEKLNENQTFYTFNATKRAQVWMQYLLENNWVTEPLDETPSFNVMVRE